MIQNFDESGEPDEESQGNPERQQIRGYGQQEYEAQDDYEQRRDETQQNQDDTQSNQNDCEQNRDNSWQYQDDLQQTENDYEQDQDNSQQSQNQRYRSNDHEATEARTSDGSHTEYEENGSVTPNYQQEDRMAERWNSERQDNTESYGFQINDRDENQGGQQYSEEQAIGEDESTYALAEQENRRRGYNTYRDKKEATEHVEEEFSYRDDYQQQENAWRGNRDKTVF